MKRYGTLVLLLFFISLMTTYIVGANEIRGSKHDLSMSAADGGTGPGPIQSAGGASGTTQICVFCHTPHSANTDAPLWNRSGGAGSYTVYTSDVLAGLGVLADDPANVSKVDYAIHVKTRICLSCHDGTIALGNLVNFPGELKAIAMLNTNGGVMPDTAAGYIDTDLSDDHPVAIKQSWGNGANQDPELKSPAGTRVRLYNRNVNGQVAAMSPPNSGDYVECTSCHDAHDNVNGNFLVDTNLGSNICLSCHRKETGGAVTGGGRLAHDSSAAGYNPDQTTPAAIGATVGAVKCMNCHYLHKSGATGAVYPFSKYTNAQGGQYLLSFQEENTCFNIPNRWNKSINVCHGQASSTKDIETLEKNRGSRHNSAAYPGVHRALEQGDSVTIKYGWLGAGYPNWHVQCNDCHNPHTAGSVNHSIGTNIIDGAAKTSPLYGAGGVSVAFPVGANWSLLAQGDFTAFETLGVMKSTSVPVNYYEYQVCFKCHSSFAWGSNPAPPSPSLGLGKLMTDQAREFNTANASYHPVAAPTVNHAGTAFTGGWGNGMTMYCSDCHADSLGASKGPHGSDGAYGGAGTKGFIMIADYTDTYSNIKTDTQPVNDICFKCHSETVYQSGATTATGTGFFGGTTNLHTQHRASASAFGPSTFGYRCVNCHARVPHGFKNKALIVVNGDGEPYEAGGTGQGKIQSIVGGTLPNSGFYQVGVGNKDLNCTTIPGCHH